MNQSRTGDYSPKLLRPVSGAFRVDAYREDVTYDKRGNIQTLDRKTTYRSGSRYYRAQIDELDYSYPSGSNRLASIDDDIPGSRGYYERSVGAIGGAICFGIGSAATSLAGSDASNLSVADFQAGTHALTGGTLSAAQSGNFWRGAAANAFSLAAGSGIGEHHAAISHWDKAAANSFGKPLPANYGQSLQHLLHPNDLLLMPNYKF